jgi:four helix bundle protein
MKRSRKSIRHFLSIAKGSAGELRAQLYIAMDVSLINEHEF